MCGLKFATRYIDLTATIRINQITGIIIRDTDLHIGTSGNVDCSAIHGFYCRCAVFIPTRRAIYSINIRIHIHYCRSRCSNHAISAVCLYIACYVICTIGKAKITCLKCSGGVFIVSIVKAVIFNVAWVALTSMPSLYT